MEAITLGGILIGLFGLWIECEKPLQRVARGVTNYISIFRQRQQRAADTGLSVSHCYGTKYKVALLRG